MSSIFLENAPRYWNAGLQVIPLKPGTKVPFFDAWNRFATVAISEASKQAWLANYPTFNLGLIPGAISRVSFVDIDVWEPDIAQEIIDALPKTPWIRKGAKGAALAYRWDDRKDVRLFESKADFAKRRLTDLTAGEKPDGVELFASGRRQMVMPPSIHPDTGKPYTASCNLYDVVDQLPVLPADFNGIVERILNRHGIITRSVERHPITEYISVGARDNRMISLAGMFAGDIIRGLRTLKECLDEMALWGEKFVENPEDDPIDTAKGQSRIIEYLISDVHRKNCTLPKGWSEGIDPETYKKLGLDLLSEDAKSLDFDDLNALILNTTGLTEPGEKLSQLGIIIRQAARSKDLSPLEKKAIQMQIKNSSEKMLNLSDVRQAFAAAAAGPVEGTSHHEIAAEVIKDFAQKDVRFDHEKLFEWGGSHWTELEKGVVVKHVAENYGNLPASKRQNDYEQIFRTVCDLARKPIKTVEAQGINFLNGFLTEDMQLLPVNREYGMTYTMPYNWEPNSLAPTRFLAFLNWAFSGDAECIATVRQAIAIALFGLAPKYQKVVLLYGLPRCGKSTLLKVVGGLFPAVAKIAIPPSQWDEPFTKVMFDGPLINIAGDLMPRKPIDAESFKTMVSNDALQGRAPYKQSYTFYATPMSWLASNCQINTDDVSDSFLRRFVIIPFGNVVSESATNINFAEDIIAEEASRIIAWAAPAIADVEATRALLEPSAATGIREMMRASINPVRGWLKDSTELAENSTLSEEDAFNSARFYNQMRGYKQRLSRMAFVTAMQECAKDLGYKCTTLPSGNQEYSGLKLKVS